MGHGADELSEKYRLEGDDYRAIAVKTLADRLAEAFAELLHRKVRMEIWGYSPNEDIPIQELLHERYRGIRPAPGYPACPDHLVKQHIFDLLNVPENTGMSLTENLSMVPGVASWQATTSLIHSPSILPLVNYPAGRWKITPKGRGCQSKRWSDLSPPIWPTMIDNLGYICPVRSRTTSPEMWLWLKSKT